MTKLNKSQKEEEPGRPNRQKKWTRLHEFVFKRIKALVKKLSQYPKVTTHEQTVVLHQGIECLKAEIAMLRTHYRQNQLIQGFLGLSL